MIKLINIVETFFFRFFFVFFGICTFIDTLIFLSIIYIVVVVVVYVVLLRSKKINRASSFGLFFVGRRKGEGLLKELQNSSIKSYVR